MPSSSSFQSTPCFSFCCQFMPQSSRSTFCRLSSNDLRPPRHHAAPLPSITKRARRGGCTPCMAWRPTGMLRDAVDIKRAEIAMLEEVLMDRPDHPVNMKRSFYATDPSYELTRSLRRHDGSLAIVPAVKRFLAPSRAHRLDDPSEGDGRAELVCALENVADDVRSLWACGADAALFYTDAVRHGIELPELRSTARLLKSCQTPLPLIRHDIIIDPIQIAEAADAGACAVNIVAAAALPEVPELLDAATMMGMEAIVECHTQLEVEFAMESGATIIFINNWDRTRNVLVPGMTEKLIANIPTFILTLGGGGVSSVSECWDLLDMGYNGVVLGTNLLRSRRPKAFIEEVRSYKRFTGDVFSGDMGIPFAEGTNASIGEDAEN